MLSIWILNFRENKNRYLLGFLHALVDLRIFVEITVEFLLVGHTGKVDTFYMKFKFWDSGMDKTYI